MQNSASDSWDLLSIFQAPKGLDSSSSSALPSPAHIACLMGSGQLHAILVAIIGGCPMVLTFSTCWVLHCNWAAPLPVASTGLFLRIPTLLQSLFVTPSTWTLDWYHGRLVTNGLLQCQDSAALHEPFMPSRHYYLRDSYIWPSSTTSMKCSPGPLHVAHRFCVLNLRKYSQVSP